jgi:response regulator RpfG family c-di-GMP phosphodiesterase
MIRLLICDDSEAFRFVVRATLAAQPEITVVGEAGDGREAVDLALALSPDVILMDVRMPLLDGVEATREITAALPGVRVVALTGSDDRGVVDAMLEAGAVAHCVKGSPLWELERAVAGAADPLVRLAHTLARAVDTRSAAELAAREVVELTGGAGTGVFLAEPDGGLSLASAAGPLADAQPTAVPEIVLDSFRRQELVQAGNSQLAELAAGVLPCDQAVAAPLIDDGDALGVLLAVMPPGAGLEIDHALLGAVAQLAAAELPRFNAKDPEPRRASLAARHIAPAPDASTRPIHPIRVLVVDDDERLRILLRTTLEVIDIEIDEAAGVPEARARVAANPPDVVVLDLGLPGANGLTFCDELKSDARTRGIGIVVLTGSEEGTGSAAKAAGADAYLRKPFSPLDLLGVVEQLAGGLYEGPFEVSDSRPPDEQLMRYAEDLRRLLELEQGQRALIQAAYRETVGALTSALEAKDLGTNAHSHRVQRYAMELAWAVEPRLVEEPSIEYGFLLHDVGKIGIPDRILSKPAALTDAERRVLETHVILGEQMLSGVALLKGGGLEVVRHHHERWDGDGYPDRLSGCDIPLQARIFSAADALDAMTSDRPYRPALSWDEAVVEIIAQSGQQFDPHVVDALLEREPRLRLIQAELEDAAPPRLLS